MNFISNLITSIRNAKNAKLNYIVWTSHEKSIQKNIIAILTLLRNNGVIRAFSFVTSKEKSQFVIYIKYDQTGKSVIRSIFNVSKSSRIQYISSKALWQPQSTTGFFVLSTSYGIITDSDARRYNVGGSILFGLT
jgi:small subunit ribosomal protein S8